MSKVTDFIFNNIKQHLMSLGLDEGNANWCARKGTEHFKKAAGSSKTHSMTLATMQDCLQDSAALNSSIQLQRRSQSQELRSRRKLSISPSKEVD